MIDMLRDILAKEPEFGSFHLDSQTIPLQDYLEIRPERRDEIVGHITAGRLLIGPWFVLPDEFCVGGEIDLSGQSPAEVAVVVWNALPQCPSSFPAGIRRSTPESGIKRAVRFLLAILAL